jgi:hypothetical protein
MPQIRHPGGPFVSPFSGVDGITPAQEGVGLFLLAPNTTYYFPIGGKDAPFTSAHIWSTDAGLVLTSVTIQDSNHPEMSSASPYTSDFDGVPGRWIPETPSGAYVGVIGTGWTASAIGVVSTNGTGVGGAMFHIGETGAARHRLAVVVGATGGHLGCAVSGKT